MSDTEVRTQRVVKYFRFIEAPHFTFKLEIERGQGEYATAYWSSLRGEYHRPIICPSPESAERSALEHMYRHLVQILNDR